MTDQSVARVPSFADRDPAIPLDRESRQQRVRAVLMTFCDPKGTYHGVTAWEVAGKILKALDEEPSDSVIRQ